VSIIAFMGIVSALGKDGKVRGVVHRNRKVRNRKVLCWVLLGISCRCIGHVLPEFDHLEGAQSSLFSG
jgi:hypothetical protein